jgi:hypothetical protein
LGDAAPADADDGSEPDWLCFVERRWSLRALFKPASARLVTAEAAEAVHAALTSMPEVSGLQWHDKQRFDAADESQGTNLPT